jgi:hypothetical protein
MFKKQVFEKKSLRKTYLNKVAFYVFHDQMHSQFSNKLLNTKKVV